MLSLTAFPRPLLGRDGSEAERPGLEPAATWVTLCHVAASPAAQHHQPEFQCILMPFLLKFKIFEAAYT